MNIQQNARLNTVLTFEYSSVHGALAAAYTSGSLAAEFGPEWVRVALRSDAALRDWGEPLLAETPLPEATRLRFDTRLLGLVPDGDGPAWALTTTHVNLERHSDLVVRALSAVLQARPHRRPHLAISGTSALDTGTAAEGCAPAALAGWIAESPLRAASILVIEDFVNGGSPLAA